MALWTPAEITTALWLDAADSSTITEVTGAVSEWADKSGNSRHATQGTAGNRPYYDSANNKITFDDANTESLGLASQPFTGATARTVFAVVNARSTGTGKAYFSSSDSSTFSEGRFWDLCIESSAFHIRISGNDYFTPAISTNSDALVVAQWLSGSSDTSSVWHDGSALSRAGGSSNTINTLAGTANIGRCPGQPDEYFDGDIYEIVVVTGSLSTSDRQLIEGYLAHKWGLEANLPSGHPYKDYAPGALTLDIGAFETQASLSGDAQYFAVDTGGFEVSAALSGTPFMGIFLEAGKFGAAGNLAESTPHSFYIVEGSSFALEGSLSGDPFAPWVDAGVFTLEGELSAPVILTWDPQYSSLPMLTGDLSAKITGVSIQGELPSIEGNLYTGATLIADLPSLEGTLTAQVERKADIEALMPMFTGQMFTGARISAAMPKLAGSVTALVERVADISADMPMLAGTLDGWTEIVGDIAATFPILTGSVSGYREGSASIAATMPRLSGFLTGKTDEVSSIFGTLPMLSGSLTAGRTIPHGITATMPALTGFLAASRPMSWGVMRYSKGAYR